MTQLNNNFTYPLNNAIAETILGPVARQVEALWTPPLNFADFRGDVQWKIRNICKVS